MLSRFKLVFVPGITSAGAHIRGYDDLIQVRPLLELVGDWRSFINEDASGEEIERYRLHERTGRPHGDEDFIDRKAKLIGRDFRWQKPGSKRVATRVRYTVPGIQ